MFDHVITHMEVETNRKRKRDEKDLNEIPQSVKRSKTTTIIVKAPIGSVINFSKLKPETIERVYDYFFGFGSSEISELSSPKLPKDLFQNALIKVDAIFDDDLKSTVLSEQSSFVSISDNTISDPIINSSNANLFLLDPLTQKTSESPLTIDVNSKKNEYTITEIRNAIDENQKIEITQPVEDTPVIIINNKIMLEELPVESYPSIIPKNVQPNTNLKQNTKLNSNIDNIINNINNPSPNLNKISEKATQNLLEKGVLKIKNKKKKVDKNINRFVVLIDKYKKTNKIIKTQSKKFKTVYTKMSKIVNLLPSKEEIKMHPHQIRLRFNNFGVVCSIQMATTIKKIKILELSSIFKISCVAYLLQKHRYNKSKLSNEYQLSHPTVTQRCISLVSIIFDENSESIKKILENIIIGQPTNSYMGYEQSDRLSNELPSGNKTIVIQKFFTNYIAK